MSRRPLLALLAVPLLLRARAVRADDEQPGATSSAETKAPPPARPAEGRAPSRNELPVFDPPSPPPTKARSVASIGAGVGLLALGSVLFGVGIKVAADDAWRCQAAWCGGQPLPAGGAAPWIFLSAVLSLGVGTVLVIEGAQRVPAGDRPQLATAPAWRVSVTPMGSGASLAVQF